MKIWRFTDPRDDEFAEGGRRGAWSEGVGVCAECGASSQQRVPPLLLAWLPGSDRIGDFTHCGFGIEMAVQEGVVQVLSAIANGIEFGPVEVVEDTDGSGGSGHRREPRVPLPYKGPDLFELWATTWVNLDRQQSTAVLERVCGSCGMEFWRVSGVEAWTSGYDSERGTLLRTKTPREPDSGIVVRRSDLAGASIFRVRECPGWVLCTDAARAVVEEAGLTNVTFLEMGECVD